MFPIFIPMPPSNSKPPSGKSIIAFIISIPLYAFLIAAVIHFSGINVDTVLRSWYGFPAMILTVTLYLTACAATAMWFN